MAKKPNKSGSGAKANAGMSAAEHRKLAETYHAKARLHSAHADLKDAKNPPKKGSVRGYPC